MTQKVASTDRQDSQSRSLSTSSEEGKVGFFSRISKQWFFVLAAIVWLALDLISKGIANSYRIGEVFAGPFLGLIQFRLAHNTGAAWSLFSDSTLFLAMLAVVVLIVLVVLVIRFGSYLTLFELTALGIVFAGGLGNAIDRFTLGYVIDFIQTLFVRFPTFNVADIGVTCGIVLFAISFFVRTMKEDASYSKTGESPLSSGDNNSQGKGKQ